MRTIKDATQLEEAVWNQFILFMATMPEQIMNQILLLTTLAHSLELNIDKLHLHELSNLSNAFEIVLQTIAKTYDGEVIPIPESYLESIQARVVKATEAARIKYSNGQHKDAYGELMDLAMSLLKIEG